MAITNAQQYKQLVNPPMKGKKRPGYRGEGGYQGGATNQGGAGDPKGGNEPQRDTGLERQRQRTIAREQRIKDVENLIDRPNILERGLNLYNKFSPIGVLSNLINKQRQKNLFANTMDPGVPKDRMINFINEEDRGGDGQQIIFPQTMMAQAPSITKQEPEDPQGLEGLRLVFRAEGGIIDEETGRQMYGLGKLVKKATRAVKKVAKSPIGKAALLYGAGSLGMAGLGQFRAGTGIFSPTGFLKSKALPFLVGKAAPLASMPGTSRQFVMGPATKGILGAAGKLSPFKAITAASLLPFAGLGTGEESEEEAQAIIDQSGLDIDAIRESYLAEDQYRARRFKAEGGSMKEPVAKKTMPLLDMGGQEMDLRAEGGFVPIGRMEKADDVPARLSKNEFVFTADAVRNAGDGNVDKGAEVMYNMMKNLEAGGEVSEESQGLEGARRMFQTSQRLEEVL
jgi:hypothetical protein